MTESRKIIERPISPHLQIYRWSITMTLSILHRATGCALAAGTLALIWFLFAIASGPEAYGTFYMVASSWVGKLVFLGWTFALYFHMGTGIRHFFLDFGYLYKISNSDRAGFIIVAWAIVMTSLTWLCIAQNLQGYAP